MSKYHVVLLHKKYMAKKDPPEKRVYVCKICGKKLPNLPAARVHVAIGHDVAKYQVEKYIEERRI